MDLARLTVVALGCWMAFHASAAAARQPVSWPGVAAVTLFLAIAGTLAAAARPEGSAALLTASAFLASVVIGARRGRSRRHIP